MWLRWRLGIAALFFVCAQGSSLEEHLIVLFDDSRDVRREQRSQIADALPGFLYGGNGGQMPRFDPEHDRLSLIFFTVHKDGGGDACKTTRSYSLLPASMFQLEPLGAEGTRTEQGFSQRLHALMDFPCRSQVNLSPTLSSPYLVLPFMEPHVPPEQVFAWTIVVLGHYEAYAPGGSPKHELRHWNGRESDRETGYIRDVEEAEKLLQRQLDLFRLRWTRRNARS